MTGSDMQLSPLGRTTESPTPQPPSMTELVSGIFDDAQKLVRQQMDMLRAEFREDLIRTKRAAEFGSLALVLITIGGLCLVAFMVNFLSEQFAMSMWAACLIVGGVLLASGIGFVYAALSTFKSYNPLPEKSINALQENLTWKTQPQS